MTITQCDDDPCCYKVMLRNTLHTAIGLVSLMARESIENAGNMNGCLDIYNDIRVELKALSEIYKELYG